MNKRILKLLYRSMDAPLGKKDGDLLSRHLAGSKELRKIKGDLLALRQELAASAAGSFRPGFVERTVARARGGTLSPAASAESFAEAFLAVFKPFAFAAVLLLVVGFSFALLHGDIIPKEAVYYVSDLSLSRILQLPAF